MGRRKERRLAAMSAAGRRVKLDLFAEPSGDLGGSSALEETVEGGDHKIVAESNSPSASGQKPQNPLLLLGQYSDEELDEDSNADDSFVGTDVESKIDSGKESGDGDINNEKASSQKVEQILLDENVASQVPPQKFDKESNKDTGSDDLKKLTNKTEEATCPAVNDGQLVESVSSGWKMVLHEESHGYYYWNVLTGETSWEVPNVLSPETGTSVERVVRDTERKTDFVTSTDMAEDVGTTRKLDVHSKINSQTADSALQGVRMDGSEVGFQSNSTEDKEGKRDAIQDNKTSELGGNSQSGADLSLLLIKRCESLLERLNSIQCLNCSLEVQDLKLKCKLEIEIRLFDMNALASHGSSLVPFWLHSETQLDRLESNVDIVFQQVNSASVSGLATVESREGASDDTEIDSCEKKALSAAVEFDAEDTSVKSTFETQDNATMTEHAPLVLNSSTCFIDNVGAKSEITGTEKGDDLNLGPADLAVEDVDMDVDMEVEDSSSIKSPRGGASGDQCCRSTDSPILNNTVSDGEPAIPGKVFVVNPPDVQWIPPPPPDNEPFPPLPPDDEPFPPPPPEEPPEASYPPPHLGSVQSFPYSEPYTLSYLGTGLEYYVQTNPEVPGTALYTHPEGSQVAPSHVPHYYEAAPSVYAVASVVVNPSEPTTYYGLENGTLNPTPIMNSSAEFSRTQSEPVFEEISTAGSGLNLLLKNNNKDAKASHVNVKAPDVPEAQTLRATETSAISNGSSDPSTSETTTSVSAAAAAAAAAAATKAQSKVSRTKKRSAAVVSTLRSNKKVSSLVDKWKAAKEELHEEEEEPEDPYEILETKRKREIEKWKAQQIASGEAKDNANFQPLGGDWRERVKRRRAEKLKESGRSSPDVATDLNHQTGLLELSKGLPSGWQAYWDDSSKKVYYGNALTSETSWIRP